MDRSPLYDFPSAITNYNYVVKVFGDLIKTIEKKNVNDVRWFTYSEKIGRKYLVQATTLQNLFNLEIYHIENEIETRFIDFSSLFILLRAQLENFAIFHFLFVNRINIRENILRFRLWELDSLELRKETRQTNQLGTSDKIDIENTNLDNCLAAIEDCEFYKTLKEKDQKYLIKRRLWRFRLNKKNDPTNIPISELINYTGIDETVFREWYSISSDHAHVSFNSVFQNDTFTPENRLHAQYVAILQGIHVTSFFIKDFAKVYEIARDFFNSLPIKEQEIINSYDIRKK